MRFSNTSYRTVITSLMLTALCLTVSGSAADRLVIRFFGARSCGECLELKETLLLPLSREYPDRIDLTIYDIDIPEQLELLIRLEEAYDVPVSSPQALFLPDTFLLGYESIKRDGRALIEACLAAPQRWYPVKGMGTKADGGSIDALKRRMDRFSLFGLITAGLLDGVNPCAIATLIFLVSFLTVKKRRPAEVMAIGLAYTATVYITYLLMGVGALAVIEQLIRRLWIARLFKWSIIAFALIVAAFSFKDAFAFKKSGKADAVTLQLPRPVKLLIHRIISSNLSGGRLVTGALVAGFLVTILEAVCTGQFYIPVITALASRMDPKAWAYLLLYNFLFVLPLLIVMVLAWQGLRWEKLSQLMQKRLPLLKVLLGTALVGLSAYLYVNM